MFSRSCPRLSFLLFLSAGLLLAGCSGDDDPVVPSGEDPLANTPPIPVVTNPRDQLPDTSEFMVIETAELRNLSPELSGATRTMLDVMDEAYALGFRLPPGRNLLIADGRPAVSRRISSGSFLRPLVRTVPRSTSPAPFIDLGSYGNSHYYLCHLPARWYFAEASCWNLGGTSPPSPHKRRTTWLASAVQAASSDDYFYIGLTDWEQGNNNWVWSSAEPVSWVNWSPGEPNNQNGEYFATLVPGGTWNDTTRSVCPPLILERAEPFPAMIEGEVPCADLGGKRSISMNWPALRRRPTSSESGIGRRLLPDDHQTTPPPLAGAQLRARYGGDDSHVVRLVDQRDGVF